MRMLSLSLCLLAASAIPAMAQSSATAGAGAVSSSQSGALAVAGSGNSNSSLVVNNPANTTATVNSNVSGTTTQNVNQTVSGATTSHIVSSGTTAVKTNPAVFAPGLSAAGLETCLGSASGGVSVLGFGLTGGSSYPDEGCQARLDARTLWAMGQATQGPRGVQLRVAALRRLCQRDAIALAMPEICGASAYAPAVRPVGYPAPVIAPTRYASVEPIMLVDGKTGKERMCNDYNEAGQKCRVWADAAPKRVKPKTAVAAVPTPKEKPVTTAEAPPAVGFER